jgi:hypothetical protein
LRRGPGLVESHFGKNHAGADMADAGKVKAGWLAGAIAAWLAGFV